MTEESGNYVQRASDLEDLASGASMYSSPKKKSRGELGLTALLLFAGGVGAYYLTRPRDMMDVALGMEVAGWSLFCLLLLYSDRLMYRFLDGLRKIKKE